MKTSPAHRAMIQKIADTIAPNTPRIRVRGDHSDSDHTDFNIDLPTHQKHPADDTHLLIRCIEDCDGARWICFLYRWGSCFAQSDGDDGEVTEAQKTPETAYTDLLRCLDAQIAEKQALRSTLALAATIR